MTEEKTGEPLKILPYDSPSAKNRASEPSVSDAQRKRRFYWRGVLFGGWFGFVCFIIGVAISNGAPQECAAAGIGLAFAVIPYCLARAVSELEKI